MSDYVKCSLAVVASEISDYVRPYLAPQAWETEPTPDEVQYNLIEATTGGTTVELGNFSSLSVVGIYNLDPTNYVEAQWYYKRGSQAAGDWAFADADPDTITDNLAGGTLITNGAEVGGYVTVAGSENSGENNGTYLIQAATIDALTLGIGEALTANANDTAATLNFVRRNKDMIAAGTFVFLGPVWPNLDLLLTANSANCQCRVLICGT